MPPTAQFKFPKARLQTGPWATECNPTSKGLEERSGCVYKGLALVCGTQPTPGWGSPRRVVSNLTHVHSPSSNVAWQHVSKLPHIPRPFLFALQKLVQQQAPCQPHRRPGWSLGQARWPRQTACGDGSAAHCTPANQHRAMSCVTSPEGGLLGCAEQLPTPHDTQSSLALLL